MVPRTAKPAKSTSRVARQGKRSPRRQRLPNKSYVVEHQAAPNDQSLVPKPVRSRYRDRVSKTRPTVSAAGVLKQKKEKKQKKKKNRDTARGKKSHRRVEGSPRSNMLTNYKDGIETARGAILSRSQVTFNSVHKEFMQQLSEARAREKTFLSGVSTTWAMLSAPLAEEQIETTTRQGGRCVTQIVKIGERIASVKEVVKTEEAKLKDYWKQWDEIQDEYVKLGVEVFGAKAFGEDAKEVVGVGDGTEKGYREDMRELDLKMEFKGEEMDEDIKELRAWGLQTMKASEKEQDALTKKEQTRLLQALLRE